MSSAGKRPFCEERFRGDKMKRQPRGFLPSHIAHTKYLVGAHLVELVCCSISPGFDEK